MKSIYLLKHNTLLVAFTLLSSGFLYSCAGKKQEANAKQPGAMPPSLVEVQVIKPQPLNRKINVTGSIIANEEIELRSEATGKVTGIFFSEGSNVSKGQLLVKINDSDLQAQLKKLVLQDTLLSRDEFRKKSLLEMNAISVEEYDNTFTQLQGVRAEIKYLSAQIEKTEIRAPFNGTIGLRNISEGGFVNPSFLIATMQQINPVKIEFSVPERYREFLKNGTEIFFTVTGNDEKFTGTVYAIESKIDPVTRTVKVRAKSNNDKGMLIPGAFAKVELILEKVENAIVIPAQAVIPEMQGQKVFLVKDGKAKSTPVELGIRTDADTEIISGIASGDTLAVTGLLQLREGASVTIANKK